MSLSPRLQAALPDVRDPRYPARRSELESLVEATGPERALHAYGWLDGSDEHRATQVDVFVEACSWHPDAPKFGGALSLARELPLDSPELPLRMAELERMVSCSTPETGLLAYRRLPGDPAARLRAVEDYQEICSWNSNLGRFGGASKVLGFLEQAPNRADALATVRGLDWGKDWLSCDAALKVVQELGELRERSEQGAALCELACRARQPRAVAETAGSAREPRTLADTADWLAERLSADELRRGLERLPAGRALELLEVARARDLALDAAELERLAEQVGQSQGGVAHVLDVHALRGAPTGHLGETEEHWVIAGSVLRKREQVDRTPMLCAEPDP